MCTDINLSAIKSCQNIPSLNGGFGLSRLKAEVGNVLSKSNGITVPIRWIEISCLFRSKYLFIYLILAWKGSIGCTFPLISTLCTCPLRRWWPAASLAGTSWGSPGTSSSKILFKMCYCAISFHQVYQNCFSGFWVKEFIWNFFEFVAQKINK